MNRVSKLAAAALSCLACASAQAVLVTLSFTASGYGVGAPTDPVVGSFSYNAASATAEIDSLQSVSLVIDGHAYTLAEVDFGSITGTDIEIIYGALGGAGIASGFNDFWLRFDRVAGTGVDLDYTTASNSSTIFQSTAFRDFTRTVDTGTPAPEPGTWALAALGLAATALSRRRA